MKITIEMDEYLPSEESLDDAIKATILQAVKTEVFASIKSRVDDQITREVKLAIESEMYKQISKSIKEYLKSWEIRKDTYSKEVMSITDWIKYKFETSNWSMNFSALLNEQVKIFTTEIKQRYDLMFGSQIIAKMNEQWFLKEWIAKLILDSK